MKNSFTVFEQQSKSPNMYPTKLNKLKVQKRKIIKHIFKIPESLYLKNIN